MAGAYPGSFTDKRENNLGVLGRVSGYGTVETQGRGSLHLHILVWIHGSKNVTEVLEKLQDGSSFSDDLLKYLSAIIKEEFPDGTPPERGTETSEKPLCSMRPIDVHDPDFNTKFTTEVARLVSQCNVHHHTDTCYKYGSSSCRFDFKRPAVDIAKIEDGVIFLRRRTGNGWVNNYNDIMTVALRCNTDIKFVCNGKDGTALSFYITDYITKKSLTTHNAIPLIIAAAQDVERGIHKCKPNPLYTTHMQNSRDLVVKCLNKLTTHSERSGPEVATLLMDKPLHYTSHKYKKVLTAPFDKTSRIANQNPNEDAEDDISESDTDDISLQNDTTDSYIMSPSDTGSITLSNQRMDYLYRSNDLSSVGLYQFCEQYTKEKKHKDTQHTFCLQEGHPQHHTHVLKRYESPYSYRVPVMVGPSFPSITQTQNNSTRFSRFFLPLLTMSYS